MRNDVLLWAQKICSPSSTCIGEDVAYQLGASHGAVELTKTPLHLKSIDTLHNFNLTNISSTHETAHAPPDILIELRSSASSDPLSTPHRVHLQGIPSSNVHIRIEKDSPGVALQTTVSQAYYTPVSSALQNTAALQVANQVQRLSQFRQGGTSVSAQSLRSYHAQYAADYHIQSSTFLQESKALSRFFARRTGYPLQIATGLSLAHTSVRNHYAHTEDIASEVQKTHKSAHTCRYPSRLSQSVAHPCYA